MGKLGAEIYRRKLGRFLKHARDADILRLIWGVYCLQTGRGSNARKVLNFPDSVESARLGDPQYVLPWNLETIVNELLTTPKVERKPNTRQRLLRGDRFETICELNSALIKLENAEDGISLAKGGVLPELHRGVQRQFEWQRGFDDLPRLYRAAFLYGAGETATYFRNQTGLTVSDFMLTGFVLFASIVDTPIRDRKTDMSLVGVTPEMRELVLAKIGIDLSLARERARKLRRSNLPTAYRGSVLRDHPIIMLPPNCNSLIAPLPPLVLNRITAGIYLDVVKGGGKVWNEIGDRFEIYCRDYLASMLDGYDVKGELEYGTKGGGFRTPDILAACQGEIALAVECKARRMTFEARYSDDPIKDAKKGYEDIAHGIFQIWRFFSHARRGIFNERTVSNECLGVILTADPWLTMAPALRSEVVALATEEAKAVDPEISDEDRRPVEIRLIDEIESILQSGNADSFVKALKEVTRSDKLGWPLSEIHDPGSLPQREYPFKADVNSLLPWLPGR